jgi:ribosomal protein S18 acetylase RimI-like enzyme
VSVVGRTNVRDANASDIAQLARIWYDGWQDAHARILPVELARLRTLQSFSERLQSALTTVRVAGAVDVPLGFCMLKGDELYQLYVSSQARGSGVVAALIIDAESRLRESGVDTAWLACAIGNERAARFYEKCGWLRTGIATEHVEIPDGTFAVEVWRYEKSLRGSARTD